MIAAGEVSVDGHPETRKACKIRAGQVVRIGDDEVRVGYQLTPMGTIIEGEWDAVMAVVGACFAAMRTDCDRIGAQIKIDYRAGANSRMRSKIDAVEARVGRKLAT